MVLNKRIMQVMFSVLIACSACRDKKPDAPKAPPPISVTVDTVKKINAVYYDEYPASVVALNQIDLRPQVSGFITGVYFKDGDRVKKGQLLYSIDAQLYAANYQQAVANLNVQQANLNRAQKDADRYHALEKEDAVARQLVDNADAELEVAKKQSDASRAAIQAVQTNVRYTKIYAPFDGVIGISAVKAGAPVTAGQTLLNTVSSDKEVAVDFNIDQNQIFRFTSMPDKKQQQQDSLFRLAFGKDIYPLPGTLSLIDRTVNSQTGTIKARLVFPNDKRLLIAGMNGTLQVKSNNASSSIVVPYKSVTEQIGEFFVYVAGDSNKVSQRKVVLGKQIGQDVIIKDGVKEGEIIVVQGVQNLKEGSVITTATPAARPANTK